MLACLSPGVSLLVLAALWILFPISYFAIKERSSSNYPTSYKEVPYIPVESDSNDTPEPKLSCNSMLSLVWKTQGLFIALFASIFSKQLLVSGVVTTKAFTDVSLHSKKSIFVIYVSVRDWRLSREAISRIFLFVWDPRQVYYQENMDSCFSKRFYSDLYGV